MTDLPPLVCQEIVEKSKILIINNTGCVSLCLSSCIGSRTPCVTLSTTPSPPPSPQTPSSLPVFDVYVIEMFKSSDYES